MNPKILRHIISEASIDKKYWSVKILCKIVDDKLNRKRKSEKLMIY